MATACAPSVFHPQVIGRGHRMLALEAWLDDVGVLGLTFAPLDDLAAAYLAGPRSASTTPGDLIGLAQMAGGRAGRRLARYSSSS